MSDSQNYQRGQRVKLGGVWIKTSAKGNVYFTGRLGAARILIMENNRRQSDADPSHEVFLCEVTEQSGNAGMARNAAAGGRNGTGGTGGASGGSKPSGAARRAAYDAQRPHGVDPREAPPFQSDDLPNF